MEALAVRYTVQQRQGRVPSARKGTRTVGVTDERMIEVDEIRERIARREYDVSPQAIAEAIMARLTAGGSILDTDAPA